MENFLLVILMIASGSAVNNKAIDFLMRILANFLSRVEIILADGGYRGEVIEQVKSKFSYLINVVMRNDEKKKYFKLISKRWIIERTFAWFDNDRRLCRNYELLMENSENMVKLSALKNLLNKI
nr:transposase [uncultured Chryseobacterium sp.]